MEVVLKVISVIKMLEFHVFLVLMQLLLTKDVQVIVMVMGHVSIVI